MQFFLSFLFLEVRSALPNLIAAHLEMSQVPGIPSTTIVRMQLALKEKVSTCSRGQNRGRGKVAMKREAFMYCCWPGCQLDPGAQCTFLAIAVKEKCVKSIKTSLDNNS